MPIVTNKSNNTTNEISFKQREADLKALELAEANELKENRKSPFSKFYQINKENSKYLSSCLKENPKALQILFFIFDHMDKYNSVVCSYKVLQEALGIGQATIARSIKYLKEHGFIYVYKSGTSNVYVANNDLVWNSWGNNAKYCKFPTNVILSASEQEKINNILDKKIQTVQIKED